MKKNRLSIVIFFGFISISATVEDKIMSLRSPLSQRRVNWNKLAIATSPKQIKKSVAEKQPETFPLAPQNLPIAIIATSELIKTSASVKQESLPIEPQSLPVATITTNNLAQQNSSASLKQAAVALQSLPIATTTSKPVERYESKYNEVGFKQYVSCLMPDAYLTTALVIGSIGWTVLYSILG